MGRFDFDRFNGFARQSLVKFLLEDLRNHDIFNESDMHSAAYFYIRDYFGARKRDALYVRCESYLANMHPDIVIYQEGRPIYVLEFKFFSKHNYINVKSVNKDLNKLAKCVKSCDSVKYGFFLMIYDADEEYTYSDHRLRRDDFVKMSVMPINARLTDKGHRRHGYNEWRARFDRLQRLQREHARASPSLAT